MIGVPEHQSAAAAADARGEQVDTGDVPYTMTVADGFGVSSRSTEVGADGSAAPQADQHQFRGGERRTRPPR